MMKSVFPGVRLSRALSLVCLMTLFCACALAQAQSGSAQVTGSVAYLERIALPPDAVIDVQLLDTSVADIAAQTVAEILINAEGRQVPIPFALTYDPAQIVPAHRYSVRATIRSGDGMLMFSTTQAYPVLTHGAPSKVNLILHRVGHGAKPGAAARPSTPPETVQAEQNTPAPAVPESKPPAEVAPEPKLSAVAPEPVTPAAAAPTATQQPEQPVVATTAPAAQTVTNEASTLTPEPQVSEKARASEQPPAPAVSGATDIPAQAMPEAPPAPATKGATATPPEAPPAATSPPLVAESTKPLGAQPSITEPATPPVETKPTEPEPALPEAPSASKAVEGALPVPKAPDSAADSETESTSRPERPARKTALSMLADTQWKLVELGGQQVLITPPQKPVTLAFSPEGRRIAGSAGCNSYLGTFSDDHGTLQLNPGGMTLMACADPAGTREKKFVAMLRSADGYKLNGDTLLLTHDGKTVAKFKSLPPI